MVRWKIIRTIHQNSYVHLKNLVITVMKNSCTLHRQNTCMLETRQREVFAKNFHPCVSQIKTFKYIYVLYIIHEFRTVGGMLVATVTFVMITCILDNLSPKLKRFLTFLVVFRPMFYSHICMGLVGRRCHNFSGPANVFKVVYL